MICFIYFVRLRCRLTLKLPEKLQLYGLYVYYVVHICDIGMLTVKDLKLRQQLQLDEAWC